jgi:hypothetical protein
MSLLIPKLQKHYQKYILKKVQKGPSRYYDVNSKLYPSVTTILNSVIKKPALDIWKKRTIKREILLQLDQLQKNMIKQNQLQQQQQQLVKPVETTPQIVEQPPQQQIIIIKKENYEEVVQNVFDKVDDTNNVASQFGSESHKYFEIILKEESYPDDFGGHKIVVDSLMRWKNESKKKGINIIATEVPIFSDIHEYAGTIDAIGQYEDTDEIIIIDWKTGNSIYFDYSLQLAAYAKAFEEVFQMPVKEASIVRLDKFDIKFEERKLKNIQESFNLFHSAHTIWKYQNSKSSPYK